MVKINKVYTKTGDNGTTGLVGGRRVLKDCARVSAYGDIDELNSYLGICRTLGQQNGINDLVHKLEIIQQDLFDIGSILATFPGDEWPGMITIESTRTSRLEKWIDELTEVLPELRSFVLPGGTELNSFLHICRAICRRAERTIITLSNTENVPTNIIEYINRLSDLLFCMARREAHREGKDEFLWVPGKTA